MNVFLAGATGVLGRRVVRKLRDQGHHVVGLARSTANEALLHALGAEPRRGDLFNQQDLIRVTRGCDAILHLATAIPKRMPARPSHWRMNDRIRTEGTQGLVNAALENGCQLFVTQSVAWIYGDQGGAWVDEETPYDIELGGVLRSAVTMEGIVNAAYRDSQLPLITLRFGAFYGPDAAHTQTMFQLIRKGRFPILGDGETWWNLIQLDDAARAVVATVENYERNLGQTFNIVDGAPVHLRDFVTGLADLLDARKPWHMPLWLARLTLGSTALQPLLLSFRCANDKARERLNWAPRFPDFRYGHQVALHALQEERAELAAVT